MKFKKIAESYVRQLTESEDYDPTKDPDYDADLDFDNPKDLRYNENPKNPRKIEVAEIEMLNEVVKGLNIIIEALRTNKFDDNKLMGLDSIEGAADIIGGMSSDLEEVSSILKM